MGELHIGVVGVVDPGHRLPPHTGGLQGVGLVDAGHAAAPGAGDLKGTAGHPLYLEGAVALHVVALDAVLSLTGPLLSEIDAAGQVPDQHQVHSLVHHLGL